MHPDSLSHFSVGDFVGAAILWAANILEFVAYDVCSEMLDNALSTKSVATLAENHCCFRVVPAVRQNLVCVAYRAFLLLNRLLKPILAVI